MYFSARVCWCVVLWRHAHVTMTRSSTFAFTLITLSDPSDFKHRAVTQLVRSQTGQTIHKTTSTTQQHIKLDSHQPTSTVHPLWLTVHVYSCGFSLMSRKSSDDYNLRSMSNLMGERRKRASDDGERSLIKAPSSGSLSSAGPSAASPAPADLERAARKQFQQDVTPGFVYVLAVFSAIGGFLFGYDTGVVSGAMLLLKRDMNVTALWQELLVSGTVAAAAVSALLGGYLNGLFGRRVCILTASFTFAIGAIVLGSAPNKEALLVGRLIVGLGLGEWDTPDRC